MPQHSAQYSVFAFRRPPTTHTVCYGPLWLCQVLQYVIIFLSTFFTFLLFSVMKIIQETISIHTRMVVGVITLSPYNDQPTCFRVNNSTSAAAVPPSVTAASRPDAPSMSSTCSAYHIHIFFAIK